MALLHHPVLNKDGEVITSAVTNLDLHDIARASRTYGVKAFYVVMPLRDQVALVKKIVEHWVIGAGARYNPKRRQALELIRVSSSYEEVINEIKIIESCIPKTIATTARSGFRCETYKTLRGRVVGSSESYVLAFGTAWGLTDDFLNGADYVLGSIRGPCSYNHLSVRSAVAITLDRFFGY